MYLLKPISELSIGFNDAENYKVREAKQLFNQIFVRTEALDRLCDSNIYFSIGEKGTGKTAHAVYLTNNPYRNTHSSVSYIRETEYQKFIELKNRQHLTLTDYVSVWKIILYLLLAQKVNDEEAVKNAPLTNFIKFRNLKNAIDEFYEGAFAPEIVYAINFAEESKLAAELISKYANLGGDETTTRTFSENRFQVNLLYIQRNFEAALAQLKLTRNHLLFIDGIDIRPANVSHSDYLDCIKGLANAIWSINTDFFPKIRDSKGRLRVVLLVRPDIFDSIGLQNQNNKIRDNAVLLDWRTTYPEYRTSAIFKLADKLFSSQQSEELPHGAAWDYYFPYSAYSRESQTMSEPSFIGLLRLSMYRPRDIISMLSILRENFVEQQRNRENVFSGDDIVSPDFTRKYSDYLLGEVKDQLLFYYTNDDYEIFLRFFTFLNGKRQFRYNEYLDTYNKLVEFVENNFITKPIFFETPDVFLQFLYELNVLCYEERTDQGEIFIRWCFRERSPTNLSPKVKTHASYSIHLGLTKALNIGRPLKGI